MMEHMLGSELKWVLLIFLISVSGCTSPVGDQLVGEWRLDSAYYFYNNFEYAGDSWHQKEIYEFTTDGVALTKVVKSSISNQYIVKGKELIYLDEQGNLLNTYEIVKLTKNLLALKTEKKPLFKGPNQNRYQVRYFSRVSTAKQ
jgi:hypothetical protein